MVYDIIRARYVKAILAFKSKDELEKKMNLIMVMLLRLRMLTAHLFTVQEVIEDFFELEDIERLWAATKWEVNSDDSPEKVQHRNTVSQLRKLIKARHNSEGAATGTETPQPGDANEDPSLEHHHPTVFKFRKLLRELAASSKWKALQQRSLCHKCKDVPQDPHVTSGCLHVYCKECLHAMAAMAASENQDNASCLECGTIFGSTEPCNGLKELRLDEPAFTPTESSRSPRRTRRLPGDDLKWVDLDGEVLPSTKTAAVMVQLESWIKDHPDEKIIVFTQWLLVCVLSVEPSPSY
jgi:hypothetical protein